MGWTPQELGAASVSEYEAALAGWQRSRGVAPPLEREDVERVRAVVGKHRRKRAAEAGRRGDR